MSHNNGATAAPPIAHGYVKPRYDCNLDAIPNELKARPQWILWTARHDEEGKYKKIPRCADLPRLVTNTYAKSNDPATWSSFEEAVAALDGRRSFYGLAWVFSADDPFVGVDLDECRNPDTGKLTPEVQGIVERFATYAEVSPSGTGLKLICRGSIDHAFSGAVGDGKAEVYAWLRYWTMTGDVLDGHREIAEAQEALDWLLKRLRTKHGENGKPHEGNGAGRPREHNSDTGYDLDEVRLALASLDSGRSENYHKWLTVGMILHSVSDSLRADWDAWSRKSVKYRPGDCDAKWGGFSGNGNASGKVTAKTLFKWAHQDRPGWQRASYQGDADRSYRRRWGRARVPSANGQAEEAAAEADRGAEENGKPARGFPVYAVADVWRRETPPRPDYFVDGVLAADQPFIIGGPEKTLKTHFAAALGFALAAGVPFLGRFAVRERARVLFMSGESGRATLEEIFETIAHENIGRGWRSVEGRLRPRLPLHTALSCPFWFFDDVPLLDSQPSLAKLDETLASLAETQIEGWREERDFRRTVVLVDTASQAMPGDQASNAMYMQSVLHGLAPICKQHGVTMGLVHHFHRRKDEFAPPTISDLLMAGFKEWCRQWILTGRRLPYTPPEPPEVEYQYDEHGAAAQEIVRGKEEPRRHALWLQLGGSAGHSSLWGVDVNEGTRRRPRWQVALTPGVRAERHVAANGRRRAAADTDGVKAQVLRYLQGHPGGDTTEGIRKGTGHGYPSIKKALEELADEGAVVRVADRGIIKNGRGENGWKRAPE